MPEQADIERINDKISSIREKYLTLRQRVSEAEPLKELSGEVKYISYDDFTLEMYSEIFKSYTLRLIDKFLAYLSQNGTSIPEEQLDFIQSNLLNSASLLLTSEPGNEPTNLKKLIRSSDMQRFVTTFLSPLRDIDKLNGSVEVALSPEDWDVIIDMAKQDISEVNRGLIDDAKFALSKIMENIEPEKRMTYLETSVELFKDLRQFAGDVASSYANDAYNNTIADCASIYSRLMMSILMDN